MEIPHTAYCPLYACDTKKIDKIYKNIKYAKHVKYEISIKYVKYKISIKYAKYVKYEISIKYVKYKISIKYVKNVHNISKSLD